MPIDLFTWKKKKSRADQILDKFEEFHSRNPEVWTLFKRFTFEMINRGKSHYSVNAVTERIRWHSDIETTGEEVKIGNNFRAHYARLFHIAFPEHDGFFFTRKLASYALPSPRCSFPFHSLPFPSALHGMQSCKVSLYTECDAVKFNFTRNANMKSIPLHGMQSRKGKLYTECKHEKGNFTRNS